MVLFIKHWAKVREINSGYRGTLSSYGYVLMVLHYLVNVVQPFVCPNLQQLAREPPLNPSPLEVESTLICRGHNIQFWRNEQEIVAFAHANQLNHNSDSIGHLLRGFFEYFAQSGPMSSGYGKGFDWGRDVLSLRSPGGLLSKQTKGWTGAKTVLEVHGGGVNTAASPVDPPVQQQMQSQAAATDLRSQTRIPQQAGKAEGFKEVRHRYLFAIEDPFELDHNVARTVTHNGIVSIRDEFRRAWRIIRSTGNASSTEDLLQDASKAVDTHGPFMQLLDDIHGVRTGGGVRA
jgi:terminal uridylyltransferase